MSHAVNPSGGKAWRYSMILLAASAYSGFQPDAQVHGWDSVWGQLPATPKIRYDGQISQGSEHDETCPEDPITSGG
ncbi:MAG: hypothetical protein Tsb002_07820 [Wenzhouxiangellaceae bacterium]